MSITSGDYSYIEEQIYQILNSNGFNLAQICGILANIENETQPDYNPRSYNANEGAYGLCQWRSGRKTNLFSKYTNDPSVYNQVRHIIDELNGEDSIAKGCLNGIPNTRDGSYEAGYKFADRFERCAEIYNHPRAQRAQQYWDYYSREGNTSITPSVDLEFPTIPTVTPVGMIPTSYLGTKIATLSESLSRLSAAGQGYGYLIDITHDREFKFYIPEFQESAGVNWESISIPGRSVEIHSYNTTNSRKITISLDLYAGVGLYTSDAYDDVVGAIHKDANFVKSLEYPDYDLSITRPPATVHLILGSAVSLEGIVEDVNVEHMKPLDSQGRSMYLKLSFTVTQDVLDPPGYRDIRNSRVTPVDTTVNNSTFFNTFADKIVTGFDNIGEVLRRE